MEKRLDIVLEVSFNLKIFVVDEMYNKMIINFNIVGVLLKFIEFIYEVFLVCIYINI